jgi:hypothetical protein
VFFLVIEWVVVFTLWHKKAVVVTAKSVDVFTIPTAKVAF